MSLRTWKREVRVFAYVCVCGYVKYLVFVYDSTWGKGKRKRKKEGREQSVEEKSLGSSHAKKWGNRKPQA